MGTPFGTLSQDVFMNCLSTGVVSNVTGNRNQLFLTDARCIPGSEGGAVWTVHIERYRHKITDTLFFNSIPVSK